MKQQNNQKEQKEQFFVKTSASLFVTLIACLVVFALSIAGMIASFNALVTQHDKHLSADICKLMTEKMNSSIRYMTDSAQNMASVLSAQNFGSPQSVYKELSGIRGGSYVSIGFLDENGNLYASEQEKLEFEKWNDSPCNRDMEIAEEWEIVLGDDGKPDISYSGSGEYSPSRTYNVGDVVKFNATSVRWWYQFRCISQVQGVQPITKFGQRDNLWRVQNWLRISIENMDIVYNYNN